MFKGKVFAAKEPDASSGTTEASDRGKRGGVESSAATQPVASQNRNGSGSQQAQVGASAPSPSGKWEQQALQCREVIRQLRSAGESEKADDMEKQLREATVDKFFKETILPIKCWSFDHIPAHGKSRASQLQLDLDSPRVRAQLEQLRSKTIDEEEVMKSRIEDVEMELFSLGQLSHFAEGKRGPAQEDELRRKLVELRKSKRLLQPSSRTSDSPDVTRGRNRGGKMSQG